MAIETILIETEKTVYIGVTPFRSSSELLSSIELTFMQVCRMPLTGCWRSSNSYLMFEPYLCKGC